MHRLPMLESMSPMWCRITAPPASPLPPPPSLSSSTSSSSHRSPPIVFVTTWLLTLDTTAMLDLNNNNEMFEHTFSVPGGSHLHTVYPEWCIRIDLFILPYPHSESIVYACVTHANQPNDCCVVFDRMYYVSFLFFLSFVFLLSYMET